MAANKQGDLETLAPGFDRLRGTTLWDRTANQRLLPIDDRGWQQWKAAVVTGPYPRYRIWQGDLYFVSGEPRDYTFGPFGRFGGVVIELRRTEG